MNCKLSKRHLTHRPIDQARVRRILAAVLVGLTLMKMPTIVASEELTIRPQAAPGPLDNPLKGWCPYTDAGEITQPYSMVFQYVSWKHLEPHEGEYRFEEWEAEAWSVARAKGKHIIFRVYVDYPNLETGMPEWLVQQGVRMRRYKDHGGGLAPDYDDARRQPGDGKLHCRAWETIQPASQGGVRAVGHARLLGRVAHLAERNAVRVTENRTANY